MMEVRTQSEGTILVEPLPAGPLDWVMHTLHVNLRSEFQTCKFCSLGQYKLRLPKLSGQGITGIQASARQKFSVFALYGRPKHAGNAGDPIICEGDDKPQVAAVIIAPDHGRPDAIANSPIDLVERFRECLVIAQQILGADRVKVPKRPVVRPHVDYVSNHVFRR